MIHLITGGSGSGKSVYAENWLIRQGGREACGKEKPFLYIATMRPFGQESRQKIMRHRNQRAGKGFATLECYQDLEALEIPENAGILLECVMNLTANESYREDGNDVRAKGEDKVAEKVLEGIRHLSEHTAYLAVGTLIPIRRKPEPIRKSWERPIRRSEVRPIRSRRWCTGSPYR